MPDALPGLPQIVQPTFKDDLVMVAQTIKKEETYATVKSTPLDNGEIQHRLDQLTYTKEVAVKLEAKLADLEVLLPNG